MPGAATTFRIALVACLLPAATALRAAQPPAPAALEEDSVEIDWARVHATATEIWENYVPEWITERYDLISLKELQAMFAVEEAADRKAEQRAQLDAWTNVPFRVDYAGRLRNDLAAMMRPAARVSPLLAAPPAVTDIGVPLYGQWLERIRKRPRPRNADQYLPVVQAAFAAEGLPTALVWLAETESAFDPRARSPVGARGLFQLMPRTARALGLSLFPLDQRTHPEASAAAAAVYLRRLHKRFGDWPLALAAYNAGEGVVSRALRTQGAKDFAGIAEKLPAETRHYVPKVLATVQVRAGVAPAELEKPVQRR